MRKVEINPVVGNKIPLKTFNDVGINLTEEQAKKIAKAAAAFTNPASQLGL